MHIKSLRVEQFKRFRQPVSLDQLEPGLNISRLSDADFLNFVRLSTYCTRYVRLKEVR